MVKTIRNSILVIFSLISFVYAANSLTQVPMLPGATKLPQDARALIDGSIRAKVLTTEQGDGLKKWLASHKTPNDALFILLGLTYRGLILNPTHDLRMTAAYYQMTQQLDAPMLELLQVLYQRYHLLPDEQLKQLNDVIQAKKARSAIEKK